MDFRKQLIAIMFHLPTAKVVEPNIQVFQVTKEKGIKRLAVAKGIVKTSYAIQGEVKQRPFVMGYNDALYRHRQVFVPVQLLQKLDSMFIIH